MKSNGVNESISDGGKTNGKNGKRDSEGKENSAVAGMGTTNRRAENERSERSEVVPTKRNSRKNILLPSPQDKRGFLEVRQIRKRPGTKRNRMCSSSDPDRISSWKHHCREKRTSHNVAGKHFGRDVDGGGGQAMLNDLAYGTQVYLVTGYTDLRRSIDGLAAIVQGQLELDPFCKGLFLFCGRRCDRIKGLLWEGDGFLLLYKRLDNGRFQWPRNETEAKLLTPQQTRWLLEGLKIEQPKAIRDGKPSILY